MNRIAGLLLVMSTLAVGPVAGSVIQADFQESLDAGAGSNRVLAHLAVGLPSVGPVLDGSNEISNPFEFIGLLDLSFDSATNILSVSGDLEGHLSDDANYQIITIDLSGLIFNDGGFITGITSLATGNAAISNSTWAVSPTVTTGFTSDSATITYQLPVLPSFKSFDIGSGTDQFQLTLSTDSPTGAPEPGTVMLTGLALTGLAAVRRRFLIAAAGKHAANDD